jgi:hypothetical protein
MDRRRFLKLLGTAAIVGGGLGGVSYSHFIEPRNLTITNISIPMKLGIAAIHISDTHVDTSPYSIDALITVIGSLKPDLVFHTGDILTEIKGMRDSQHLLKRLGELCETYVVVGNHDVWSGVTSDYLKYKLDGIENVYVLGNESIYHDGFWIIGVDDPYTYNDDLTRALENVDSGPRILLAHSPQIIGRAAGKVDLVLCGHTHGGQVRIPFIGPLWLPLPPKYTRYDYGLFAVSETKMFVSRGIGTSFLPVRFNCPPEIVLLSL